MSLSSSDLWKDYYRQWSGLGAPLRPSPEDVEFTRSAVAEWLHRTQHRAPTLMVMGVTPELCDLQVDSACRLIALDQSFGMIRGLWHPRADVASEAVCGDWRRLPLADSSIDLALGDGSLSFMSYPAGYVALLGNLCRVLRPRGRCIVRCYTQIDQPETVEDVFRCLCGGRIGGFHAFKFRLMMALQADARTGVAVRDVWNALHRIWPELHGLAEACSWPLAEVLTVRAYRNARSRYSFPTRAEYCEVFAASGFSVVQVATPRYELGERCPTFVLERSKGKT